MIPRWLRPPLRWLLRRWARLGRAPGYLYIAVERWGARLASRPLEARLFDGSIMRCDLRTHVDRQIYFLGAYEPIEAYLFSAVLRPGMAVVDAGANVGQYTLLAARAVGPAGRVHAFEPAPSNFQRLVSQVAANGFSDVVHLNQLALWESAGRMTLSLPPDAAANPGSYTLGKQDAPLERHQCLTVTLDGYVAQHQAPRVDLIKMDLEGAEWHALKGATSLLRRSRPIILMEINREACRAMGYEPDRIWDLLEPLGYRAWKPGYSAETSGPLQNLREVSRANVFFHTGPLPAAWTAGWSLKSILRR